MRKKTKKYPYSLHSELAPQLPNNQRAINPPSAAVPTHCTMIEVGQTFPSATHLHQEVEDLSIEEKFRFLTVRHDRVRVDYQCSQHKNGCAWRVAAWVQGVDSDLKEARVENAGMWKVSIMERLHNCVAADENVGHPTAIPSPGSSVPFPSSLLLDAIRHHSRLSMLCGSNTASLRATKRQRSAKQRWWQR